MGYERSRFGDGSASGSGNVTTAVNNHYGAFNTGKTNGVLDTHGAKNELLIDIDGAMVDAEAFPLMAPYIPGGSRIIAAYLEVTEAFDLGGTTPVIEVGTEGSEATNGVTITEAQAEATGVYDITSALAGTWASTTGLAADTTIGIDLAGTSPTSDVLVGKARLVIEYIRV